MDEPKHLTYILTSVIAAEYHGMEDQMCNIGSLE